LLAEAGFPNGFSVQAWNRAASNYPWLTRGGEAIQQDLATVGIKVDLLQLEPAVGNKRLWSGQMPMWIANWGPDFPDPSPLVTQLFATSAIGAANWGSYSNPKVDQLIVRALAIQDPLRRCDTWKEIEKIIFKDDLAAVPIFFIKWPVVRSPRLENFIWQPFYKRPWYENLWISKDKQ
jgi:peptide/nickel transport system substrate-binding protein